MFNASSMSLSTLPSSRYPILPLRVHAQYREPLVNKGLTTPPHFSFASATHSGPGQQVGATALLLVHLLTGGQDLTIH